MMRSLYSGVAGLRTHQTKMDVLGNNIANVNTTSFKSQSITFSDLMYQTTQSASGATETKGGVNARQIGLGAKSGAIATAIESQGATQTTNNPFDIMITGKSFFVVNNGKENLYTRDGSFYVDGAGNLAMQSNGYFVMGWTAQEDPETGEISVNKNGGLSQLQIMSADNTTYSPASTTAALFSGNIDNNDTNIISDDGKTITLEFYDNKGYLYTAKFSLKDTELTDDDNNNIFSLQLTDIIDSDGKSIGSTLLNGVTFGSTETKDFSVDEAYEVEVGTTTADINLLAGATVYSGVPTTGALSDLMTTSKSSYAGILEKVYSITDAMVTSGTNGYSKTSAYEISESGILTITYDEDVASEKCTDQGYTYSTSSSYSYYVSGDGSGLAYIVPNSTSGYMTKLSTPVQTSLQNVFGMSSDELSTYTSSGKYLYTFTSNSSGNDVFTVYRDSSITQTTQATSKTTSYFENYYDDFEETETYGDLETALANASSVFYTFDGSNLVVYDVDTSDTSFAEAAYETVTSISEFVTENPYAFSSITEDQLSELTTLLYNAGLIDSADSELATDYMEDNKYTYFSFVEISGTTGIIFYSDAPSTVASTTILYSGSEFSKDYTADEDNYTVTAASNLGGFFTKSSDGSAYVISGTEEVLSDYDTEFLSAVYGIDGTEDWYEANLKASISSAGTITLSQTLTTTPELNSDYAATLADDGSLTYITTNDTLAWDDMPLTGNITDLLTTSTGTYKNVLSKVFGVTDDIARAFGSDGTYSINADGSITLTTGTQTIQLKFKPENGALASANAITSGLVNMKFDQSVDGLEAFGYQSTSTDDAADAGKLTFDFSTVTNYNTSGTATIKVVKGDKSSLNTGRMVGEMNGITVATDGQIHATYSNGQTKLLGQIASAEFANASGLSKEGDNLYASTLNSGEATIQDITVDGGYMNTGVLEMSNVDLSKEFTEMITTQRGFQANSRIITVSDTLLEELTNLKR